MKSKILTDNFGQEKRWVSWEYQTVKGKKTKVPKQKNGLNAKSSDPTTWSKYSEIITEKKGIMFTPDKLSFGIDLDHFIVNGMIDESFPHSDAVRVLIDEADTYTEVSPSSTGVHLYFHLTAPFNPEANKKKFLHEGREYGFEVYSSDRFFTVTEDAFEKEKPVRTITPEEAISLLSILGYPWGAKKARQVSPSTDSMQTSTLTDSELLDKMFASKNGRTIHELWDGNKTKYNNDDSSADAALCMHLAFWTQKDTEQMRRLWLSSPLGKREKTQRRKDYQDRTISFAIASTDEVYTLPAPAPIPEIVKELNLMANKKGVPFVNAENAVRILSTDKNCVSHFRYNDFFHAEEIRDGEVWRELEKKDINFYMLYLQRTYEFFEKINAQMVEDAIIGVCAKNKVNPPKDWLLSLVWDKTPRLNTWLRNTYGVAEMEYHESVGANWLKGLVKRIIYPGCKFDFVLILEGPQGWQKTESLSVLGRGYHVETILSAENKDFFMVMGRNIIVEFSEGHTMNRSDTRLLKSIITMKEDQYRVPYGRGVGRFPRQCVFAMTTNESTYLRDETGNRRFLPVEIKNPANIEWLKENLEQLYAEAYHRAIVLKETIWEFPEIAQEIQQSKMVENPYTEKLVDWYTNLGKTHREEGVTVLEAYKSVWLELVPGGIAFGREMSIVNTMQVASLFSSVLKLQKKKVMSDGSRTNRWFPTAETPGNEKETSSAVMEEEFVTLFSK